MSLFLILIVIYMAAVAVFPSEALSAASESLAACLKVVIPSLFPFMVGSRLLMRLGACELLSKWFSPLTKHLFGMNGSASMAIVMGLLGGFPVGASVTAELYKSRAIDKASAERLLGYTNNAGPLFIMGTVATGLMGRPEMGIKLYLCQLFSALFVGMLFAPRAVSLKTPGKSPSAGVDVPFGTLLSEAVDEAVKLLLNITGFVMLFGVVIRLLGKLPFPTTWFSMFLEITNGTSLAAKMTALPSILQFALLSAVIGWSGVSVHMQVLSVLKGLDLSTKFYWLGKLLQTGLSFLFGLVFAASGSLKAVLLFMILAGVVCFGKRFHGRKGNLSLRINVSM